MFRTNWAGWGWGFLLLGTSLAFAEADGSRPRPEPRVPQVVRELTELRTPEARHFLLDNGQVRAEIHGGATHYKDGNGQWLPLAPRLRSQGGTLSSDGSLLTVQGMDELVISDRRDAETVSASALRLNGQSQAGPWQVRGNDAAERGGTFTERLTLGNDRVVREVVLRHAPGGDAQVSGTFTLPDGWGVRMLTGTEQGATGPSYPVIVDGTGRTRLHFLPPVGYEEGCSVEDGTSCWTVGRMGASLAGRTLTVEVTFPGSWLNAPGRNYPVVLDPSLSYNGNYGGYIYNNSVSGWYLYEANPTAIVRLCGDYSSSGPTAGYIKFDLTSIPATARVTDSTINAYLAYSNANALIYGYDAGEEAPYGGLTTSQWAAIWSDLRGGELHAVFSATNGGTGLLGASGNSNLDRDVQSRLPDGFFVEGFVSDGTGAGDTTQRRLDSDATVLSVTYDVAAPYGLMVSELNLGGPDWVEIYNYGADVTMTNFKLNTWDGSVKTYTFPAFTLKRHSFVRVIENAGTDTATELYTGVNWAWNPGDNVEVGLTTSSSLGAIDYVKLASPADSTVNDNQKWNGAGVPGSANVVRRVHDDDTDQAYDWVIGGSATPGAMNAGLVGNRRRSPVVLNEVSTSPDAVEIVNYAEVPFALDGWFLATYTNDTLDGTGYAVPAGVTVPPGGVVRISESTGTDTLREIFTGYNIGWTTGTTGEVQFYQNAGTLGFGDVLLFNNPQDIHLLAAMQFNGTSPAPEASLQFARTDHSDADSSLEWAGTSSHTLGTLNPGQTDALRTKSWEIGTSSATWTSTNWANGNTFTATQDGVLVSYKQELTVNAVQDVTLYVLENAGSGYAVVFSKAYPSQPIGNYVLSTGLAKVPMVSGRSYAFLTHGAGSITWVREVEAAGCPEYAGFGTFGGWVASSGGPGSVANNGTGTAVHQWIEVIPGSSTLPALAITTASLPDGKNGTAYSTQMQATGGSGGYAWNIASGSLPSGLTMTGGGLISGTPTGTGTWNFTLRVTDAFGNTTTRAYSVYIVGPAAVRWVTSYLPDGVVGQQYPAIALQAEGGTAPYTFTLWSGTFPAGLSMTSGGLISGTPTTVATYSFTLRVTDSAAHAANKSFTVSVDPAGEPDYWIRRGLNGGELGYVAVSPNWATDQTAFVVKKQGHKLFVTHDQGRTWNALDLGLGIAQGSWKALALSPTFNANGSNGVNKTVLGLYYSGTTTYLVRSTNGGASWSSYVLPAFAEFLVMSPNYASDTTVLAWSQFGTGGLMKSTTGGTSWTTLVQDVYSAKIASDGSIIALGPDNGAEYCPLLVSTDGGASFATRSLVYRVRNLDISPNFATDHTLYAHYELLWRSTDGGFTWTDLTNGIPDQLTPVRNLVMQPTFDYTQNSKRNVFITSGAPKADILLYRSTDGGNGFTQVSTALPDEGGDIGYIGGGGWAPMDIVNPPVHISPNWETDGMLFDVDRGFWISEDSGVTWQQRSEGISALHFTVISYSPAYASDRTLYAATADGGLYKSSNGGATMTRLNIPHATDATRLELDIRSIAIASTYNDLTGTNGDTVNETKTLFVCGEGGAYRSRDGGVTWTAMTLPATYSEELYNLEEIRTSPSYLTRKTVMVANEWHLWRSTNGGDTWSDVARPYAWPDKFYIEDLEFSPNYNSDNTVIMSGRMGVNYQAWRCANFNGTPTWAVLSNPDSGTDWDIQLGNGYWNGSATARRRIFWIGDQKTIDNGATWSTVDPGHLSTLFYTDDTLLRTTGSPVNVRRSVDGGATDSLLSSDADLSAYPMQAGPFIGPSYSPTTGTVLYAMDGVLLYSNDGGATYAVVLGDTSISVDIRGIDTNPTDSSVIYVATGDQGLYKSTDKGITFHHLTKNLPTSPVGFNTIRVIQATPTTILAGHTTNGIYRSTDSGVTWSGPYSTGNIVELEEGGGYVFAARQDGRSLRAASPFSSWTLLDASRTNISDVSYRGSVIGMAAPGSGVKTKPGYIPGFPGGPMGSSAAFWGTSLTQGTVVSSDNGTTFQLANGSAGAYPLPLTADFLSVLAYSNDVYEVLTGTNGNGLWKTWDGGDTWHPMTRGLTGTSGVVAELHESPNGDILAGVVGTLDGGVYLSADGGVHWMVINEGFDPNELSVQDLVNDTGTDGTISYWAGKLEDGIWTRSIEVLPAPTVVSLNVTTGSALGGTSVTVTGTNFQDGAVVEFDGIPGVTTYVNATTLTVTTPAHYQGTAVVTVVNPDTRTGLSGTAFTFTDPSLANLIVLTVTKSGSDAVLTWTDPPPTKGGYNVFWTTDPTFTNWVELAAENVPGPTWTHTGVLSNSFAYYYKVE